MGGQGEMAGAFPNYILINHTKQQTHVTFLMSYSYDISKEL